MQISSAREKMNELLDAFRMGAVTPFVFHYSFKTQKCYIEVTFRPVSFQVKF
jgi:hypothetical protein